VSLLPFAKMEGLGNDYVYVFSPGGRVAEPARLARVLCDRRRCVGADGLVLISRSGVADAAMRIFNRDGSEAEMCGNALRCVARFLYERGLAGKQSLTIATGAGVLGAELHAGPGRAFEVTADLGEPDLRPEAIGLRAEGDSFLEGTLEVDGEAVRVSCVSMGNPHAVLFVPEISDAMVRELGPRLERHGAFSRGTNVEFVEVLDRSHLRMRVWERGSGETTACGSGAAAALVAAVRGGRAEPELTVTLPGGDLRLVWREDGRVYQSGPAELAFEGSVDLDRHGLPADAVADAALPGLVSGVSV
jgi:diaminopimelate epimerase